MLCGEAKVKPHVSHVEQELPTLPEHLSSSQIFSDLVLLELSFSVCWFVISSNNKTLNARLLARVITGCHYT